MQHKPWIFDGLGAGANFVQLPDQCKAEHPELWAEIGRVLPRVSDTERCRIYALVTGTCPHCFAAPAGCQCWNDE